MLTVCKTGEGALGFRTVQSALDWLERHPLEERRIQILPGVYEEQVTVRVPGVEITGICPQETAKTRITGALGAWEILGDGKKRGTFRTYTCLVDAADVTFCDLTIENVAGPGREAGQAIALYVDGDRFSCLGCRLLGWQDTLFTAPLPPKEVEKDGFIGPKQFAPRKPTRQYYRNCYIEGEVDFVFGGAAAYFEDCTFFSKDGGRKIRGFVTAASTPQGQPFGYVMAGCRFLSNCPDQTVYLGRPWREYARVVLLSCEIGPHIRPEGWDDWKKSAAHETAFFAESACTGPGAACAARPSWTHVLGEEEAARYSRAAVLGGEDGWEPEKR